MAVQGDADEIIRLKTLDKIIEVRKEVALKLGTVIACHIKQGTATDPLPILRAESRALENMIEFYTRCLEIGESNKDEITKFGSEFMENRSDAELRELFFTVNVLDSKNMLYPLETIIAKKIENKSVEYIRHLFGITNDFTEEEEAAVRAENPWVFEDVDPEDFVVD